MKEPMRHYETNYSERFPRLSTAPRSLAPRSPYSFVGRYAAPNSAFQYHHVRSTTQSFTSSRNAR